MSKRLWGMAELVRLEAERLVGLRRVVPFADRLREIPQVFDALMPIYDLLEIPDPGPEIATYRMVSETEIEVTVGLALGQDYKGFDVFELPAAQALCHRHEGAFDGLPAVYPTLHAEADARGLGKTGLAREIYRHIDMNDPARNICDVYLDVVTS